MNKDISILQKNRVISRFPYLLDIYKKVCLSLFKSSPNYFDCDFDLDSVVTLNINTAKSWSSYYLDKCPRIWSTIEKIVNSNYSKRHRILKRITAMFNGCSKLYFGTLTFTDSILNSTSVKTRRTYVARFLKSNCNVYVSNVDFGDTTNREHYHFIADINSTCIWPYGIFKFELVRQSGCSDKCITKYIAKLTNHCVKGTAGFTLASRQKK